MTSLSTLNRTTPWEGRASALPEPPGWAFELAAPTTAGSWEETPGPITVRVLEGERFALISSRARSVLRMNATRFQEVVATVYDSIADLLARRVSGSPVRFWNFIPGILEPLGEHPQRYHTFNAGRHHALAQWHESAKNFPFNVVIYWKT